MTLIERVHVAPRFQRAIRIDTDLHDPHALEGFLCPQSATETLLTMGRHISETGHSAFTWTGPYGSGKSSLVLALHGILAGDARRRARAAEIVGKKASTALWRMMPPQSKGWQMLPVIGRRASPAAVIGECLSEARLCKRPRGAWSEQMVLKALDEVASAQEKSRGGLILVIDEMGKFLEGAAADGTDIFFFQQVAELASRSAGRLVVIGILHQAFDEYAQRLAREQRDEWSKVQGRFLDLLVDTANEEQLELLARAIQFEGPQPERSKVTAAVAEAIGTARRSDPAKIAPVLGQCLPLHPIVAALLGPISRRRFGQNQRSVFGFLNSAEPYGFQDFLRQASESETYDPPRLWNYLRTNLEPSILASSDGHRWSSAVEVVERCEAAQGERLHIDVLKTIAIVELFRERSGLSPTKALLAHAVPGVSEAEVRSALDDLSARSLVVFRKHLNAYGVYAGSDFDIEAALDRTMSADIQPDFNSLRSLAAFQPVVAKRHYHSTGSLRWFDLDVVPAMELKSRVAHFKTGKGAMGLLLLPIPTPDDTPERMLSDAREALRVADYDILVGVSPYARKVMEAAKEALALEQILEERPELSGDRVAHREVTARLSSAQSQLENTLRLVLDTATWVRKGAPEKSYSAADLSALASDLADARYPQAPKLFNELLNRVSPSTNANSAKNLLLKAMVTRQGEERLGMEGFPAQAGLFMSLIAKTGLYRRGRSGWKFQVPGTNGVDPAGLAPLWRATDDFLRRECHRTVPLSEMFALWRAEPFGVKDGVHEVLGLAYALSRRDRVAYYRAEVFQSTLTDLDADYLINDSKDLQLRWLELSATTSRLLGGIQDVVSQFEGAPETEVGSPLEVARALVATFDALEPWTKKTARLSPETLAVRNILRHASDPNTLLFDELPASLLGQGGSMAAGVVDQAIARVSSALAELRACYATMLRDLRNVMLRELDMEGNPDYLDVLRERAKNVQQISGDFRLNAFIGRLVQLTGEDADMEGIAALAVNKPPREWTDADLDQARLEIGAFAQQFVRVEALAMVSGRKPKRHAMAVVVGIAGRKDARSHEFAVSDHDLEAVQGVIAVVEHAMASATTQRKNVILAALAEISAKYMGDGTGHAAVGAKMGAKA